jgi:hypothetical protein
VALDVNEPPSRYHERDADRFLMDALASTEAEGFKTDENL